MRRKLVTLLIFASPILAGVALFLREKSGNAENPPDKPAVRSVCLENRTITAREKEGIVPKIPDMPARLSVRGTAPFIVVSRETATLPVRQRIVSCGARVTGVVAPYGIVVEADACAAGRIAADSSFLAIEALAPEDKIAASLKGEIAEASGNVSVSVVPLRKDDASAIERILAEKGCEMIRTVKSRKGSVFAKISPELVCDLSERGDVRWIESFVQPELLTDIAVRPGILNALAIRETYGLTGRGQRVTISDSGLDTGNPATVMADFRGRIDLVVTVDDCLGYDKAGHGTHVAGILAGDGSLSEGWFKGVAPEVRLNVFQCADSGGMIWIPEADDLLGVDWRNPSYLHSGSWGGGSLSRYSSWSAEFDAYLWINSDVLAVFAAGNKGAGNSKGLIMEPAGAKNVIAVGASENVRPYAGVGADNPSQIASFSARGPMSDGRIKPDVCAPGSYVVSTRSTHCAETAKGLHPGFDRYMYDSGTSMATPFVSGCAALVRQWLVQRRNIARPSAALMKAILTGGAYDMSGDPGSDCGGVAPNGSQGWGRIDLGQSLYPTNATVMLVDRIAFSDGSLYTVDVTVTNRSPLAVQLVWIDYPGTEGAAKAIVNNLDLMVSNKTTGAVWYGNGVAGGDVANTVESVRIPSADIVPGVHSVTVKGSSVLYSSGEGGAAALYVRGAFSEDVFDSWSGDRRTEFGVRSYIVLSSGNGRRWKRSETKALKGSVLRFSVPASIPGGAESIDVTSAGGRYSDENGKTKDMKVQRLGRIEIAPSGGESGVPVTNAAGHMATSFSVLADGDKDILFKFYDEASTNVATTLPSWWYRRHVEGDPLADTVRFTAVSPSLLEWTGGAGHVRVLERTESLGQAAAWSAVYTCPPAPVLTNSWVVPVGFSTNSFFRIR